MALPHWPAPVSVVIRFDAGFLIIVSLRDSSIWFVTACGTAVFEFIVDFLPECPALFPIYAPGKGWSDATDGIRIVLRQEYRSSALY